MKKRALSVLMASAMAWSAMAVPAFAADVKTTDKEGVGVSGKVYNVGEIQSIEHREHFRVLVPTTRSYTLNFYVDAEKNGRFSKAYGNNAETVYFVRDKEQKWMDTQLPVDDVTTLDSGEVLSNQASDFLVVSNVGSQDVTVTATATARTGNTSRKMDVGLLAWARNPYTASNKTAANTDMDGFEDAYPTFEYWWVNYATWAGTTMNPDKDNADFKGYGNYDHTQSPRKVLKTMEDALDPTDLSYKTDLENYNKCKEYINDAEKYYNNLVVMASETKGGWKQIPTYFNEKNAVKTGVDIVVGCNDEKNKLLVGNRNESLTPGQEQDYGEYGTVWSNASWQAGGILVLNNNAAGPIVGTTADKMRDTLKVRLVRAGGHVLPTPENADGANGKIWKPVLAPTGEYYDDANQTISKYDQSVLDCVSSVAFQVTADAYGKGWSRGATPYIDFVWSVESDTAHAAAIVTPEDKVVRYNTADIKDVTIKTDRGEGNLKATGIKGVYWTYGVDNKQMELVSTGYAKVDMTELDFTITLTAETLYNLANVPTGDDTFWIPASMTIVFNTEGGGTTEEHFTVINQ